jgi:RHS repeat-associated protein
LPQARSDNQLVYTSINQLCYAGSNNTAACTSPPSGSLPYTYDAGDNLTKMGAAFQTFNNADQLCWTGSTSGTCSSPPSGVTRYAYDTRGNRVTVTPPSGGPTTLAYDQANRLVGYGATATYAYNGDGLRMSKTISGSTTQFLWDVAGPLPLLLKDGFVQYVYGAGGSPLEQISGSTVLWLQHDQLGSTRLVTDGAGSSKATYSFDPYGNLTASTGTITNPFRFAGEYRDAESGLLYLRARYYDPSTGQFISRDPITATTRAPYSYSANNPLNVRPIGALVRAGRPRCNRGWSAGWGRPFSRHPASHDGPCGLGFGGYRRCGRSCRGGGMPLRWPDRRRRRCGVRCGRWSAVVSQPWH